MPPFAARIRDVLGMELVEFRDVGGQHGYRHVTGTLADGRLVFAKVAPGPGETVAAAFTAEANGLRWLAAANGGPPVPRVIGVAEDFLVIELLAPLERAAAATARRLGGDLARMHAAGAPSFGAPWPGYIASLPLDNDAAETDWGRWYAERRLAPYLRRAYDDGALTRAEVGVLLVERVGEGACDAGPFGAPHLADILQGYLETTQLADGWRSRVSLHQLHPLLVHVCLFGGGYTAQLRAAARAALGGRNNM